jgi:putative ABC transport system permease protein
LAVVALASLALGVSGVTVVFSVVRALLLAPLPYAEPERLVLVQPNPIWEVYQAWQADHVVFDAIGGYNERAANLSGAVEPQRILMGRVTDGFLQVAGVRPVIGRTLAAGDFEPGSEPVALITDRLWRRLYAASPDAVGRALTLDDRVYTIVGVLPPSFRAPTELVSARELSMAWGSAVLVPLVGSPLARDPNATDRMYRGLAVLARLRPGVTVERAQSDLGVIGDRVPLRSPRLKRDYALVRLPDYVAGDLPKQLAILAVAVGLLLIVACANVASLVLAHGMSREADVGMRVALGASRARLVRQALGEALALGLAGGAIGVVMAWAGTRLIAALGAPILSRLDSVSIDPLVLVFAVVGSIGTGLAVGILPALKVSTLDPVSALKARRGFGSRSRRGLGPRWLLVPIEVALSLILLVGAALLGREFVRLVRTDLGFRTADTLTADLSLSRTQYAGPEAAGAFFRDVLERASVLPGVESAALGSTVPAGPGVTTCNVEVDRATPATIGPQADPLDSFSRCEVVAGDYFRTLAIPIIAGRPLDRRDHATSQPVVVVSDAFARKHWGGAEDAPGREVRFGRPTFTVVGVAGDVRDPGSASPPFPAVYFPYEQFPGPSAQMTVFLHGRNPAALAGPLTELVRSLNPNQPLFNVLTLDRVVFSPLARLRLIVIMIAVFGGVTVLVAAAGVYGTTSYDVSERMHEMGIRLALGSSPQRLFRLIVRDGMTVVLIGAVLGLPLARAFTRLLASQLEGIGRPDASTYAAMFVLVVLVGLAGTAVPASRSMRADPREILRSQ